MLTAASPRPVVSPAARDRKFYTGMGLVMMLTALVGFSRTYFLGLISGHATTITGRVPNATVHLHAFLFTSWLVLFIMQTSLVATHRVKVHRKLGYLGVALGAAMIIVGARTAVEAARLGASGQRPVELHGHSLRRHYHVRVFFLWCRLLAQRQGQTQAADDPRLR